MGKRNGGTGDAQIFANTASHLFDYAAFARKYMKDMCDGQRKNGIFRQITPVDGIDIYMNVMDGSPGWSDAGVLIPYRIWKQYGDERMILRLYMPSSRRNDCLSRLYARTYGGDSVFSREKRRHGAVSEIFG